MVLINRKINYKKLVLNLIMLLVLMTNIGCDRISKNMVRQSMSFYQRISLLDNHLTIIKVENQGAFLSVGSELPEALKLVLLSVIPLLALTFGVVYLLFKKNLTIISKLALSCAIGGGIGNIYDRLIYGSVTDFVHIDFGIFETGIFNMADVSIMTGLLLFLFQTVYQRINPKIS